MRVCVSSAYSLFAVLCARYTRWTTLKSIMKQIPALKARAVQSLGLQWPSLQQRVAQHGERADLVLQKLCKQATGIDIPYKSIMAIAEAKDAGDYYVMYVGFACSYSSLQLLMSEK